MALSRLTYNSLNVTPTASKGIGFDSGADDLSIDFAGGAMTFIKKLTASASGTLDFVDGTSDVVLDNTYKEYLFIINNVHPGATSEVNFMFNFTIDGTNWNVTKTGTMFETFHNENDGLTMFRYGPAEGALAQGTGDSLLMGSVMRDADGCGVGIFRLFNPASTTFVKHYIANVQYAHTSPRSYQRLAAGYANTTSAITGVRFLMNTGNIDSGTISLYGIN